jgi:hypothetical protein
MIHELRAWVKRAEMRWHGFIEHAKVYWGLGSWITALGLVVVREFVVYLFVRSVGEDDDVLV